jgi:transposase
VRAVKVLPDREGGKALLSTLQTKLPRLQFIWADSGYTVNPFKQWVKEHLGIGLQTVKHAWTGIRGVWVPEGTKVDRDTIIPKGFPVLPKRWIVERTFVWLSLYRRLSRDFEGTHSSSEAFIYPLPGPDWTVSVSSSSPVPSEMKRLMFLHGFAHGICDRRSTFFVVVPHLFNPDRLFSSPWLFQICQLADMMNLYFLFRSTELTGIRKHALEQFALVGHDGLRKAINKDRIEDIALFEARGVSLFHFS